MELNTGNTAWVLMSSALVMLMTPGLGLFYGGLVRKKNVLSTLMHSYFILCLIAIVWALWGYSLAFGGTGRFIGNLDYIGLARCRCRAGRDRRAGNGLHVLPDDVRHHHRGAHLRSLR